MTFDGFMEALGLLGIPCNWISTVTVSLMCEIKPTADQQGRQQGLADSFTHLLWSFADHVIYSHYSL